MSSSQIQKGQVAVILREFNYSQILNRSEHERRAIYNQFFIRLEDAVRREMKFLIIFIDFLQRDREAFKNVDVFILFRDLFPHIYSAYQTHRTIDDRKRTSINTIENN